jgi:hypothetical protein
VDAPTRLCRSSGLRKNSVYTKMLLVDFFSILLERHPLEVKASLMRLRRRLYLYVLASWLLDDCT